MLSTLSDFPLYPNDKEIPLCEIEGRMQFSQPGTANIHIFTPSVSSHPHILITKETLHHMMSKHVANKVFLPVTDGLCQKLQNAWYERGLTQVLEILADPGENDYIIGQIVATKLLTFINYIKNIKLGVLREKEDRKTLIDKEGPVVYMTWHPHCSKLAVATKDDSVSIYSINCQLNPILKAKTQRQVTSLAWRPLSSCEIAVGCYEGVYLWTVDPNSVISRPSINCATHLQAPNHRGITSIAWSPQGDILASASASDHTMYLWDVEMKNCVLLKRVGGGGISLLSWSPDGTYLFAATTETLFRVWDVNDYWNPEVWHTPGGDIVAACWSPGNSETLLFATRSEPFLYAMASGKNRVFSAKKLDKRTAAVVVADFTRTQLANGDLVGGEVTDMAWDRKGKHLAVIFKNCNLIAVYRTNILPHFHIAPGFFIKGMQGETPSAISFQNDFVPGSNLTIAWSSGRVQYFPIVFTHQDQTKISSISVATGLVDQSINYYSFSSP